MMLSTIQNTLLAVCNAIPFLVFAKRADTGEYIFVNTEWERVTGIKWTTATGRTDVELFGEKIGRIYMDNDRRVVESGDVHTFIEDTEGLHESRMYSSTKIPVRDENGVIQCIACVAQDITETLNFRDKLLERIRSIEEIGS